MLSQEYPLHIACKNGDVTIAKLLLGKGARINRTDHEDRTALFRAVEASKELVKINLLYVIRNG